MIPKRPARMTLAILEYATTVESFTPIGFRREARGKWGHTANIRILNLARLGILEQLTHGTGGFCTHVESRFAITDAGRARLEELRKDVR